VAVDRIGATSKMTRDSASAGFEALDKRAELDQKQMPRNEKVDAAAKLYEKTFLREMVKAMRGTTNFGAEKPSMGEGIYKDELDNEYVESWGDHGGVGLANLIYDQIMERYFNSTGDGHSLKGQSKGLPLTDKDVSRVIRIKATEVPGQVPLRVELKKSEDGSPSKLKMPWDGEVVSSASLEGGKTALTLQHGPSLRSTLIFKGVAAAEAQPGIRLEQGKTVGILSPEIHSFLWNLNRQNAPSQDLDGSLAR
jgi:flagellar protein FlgJ